MNVQQPPTILIDGTIATAAIEGLTCRTTRIDEKIAGDGAPLESNRTRPCTGMQAMPRPKGLSRVCKNLSWSDSTMSGPHDPRQGCPVAHSQDPVNAASGHETDPSSCPRCLALEARIAELEAAAERNGINAEGESSKSIALPLFDLKALRLIPYGWGANWQLRPSPPRRHWMDQINHSYQCLPLLIANQWGWQILCPTDIVATWDGTPAITGLKVEVDPQYEPAIKSQFGSGIITFSPPWLFRTPPGWDLYLKGPSNRWKANCAPLEGVIETWWLNYTFTLNWKIIEPGTVTFAKGESLGQLVPVPHGTFQNSTAIDVPIGLEEPKAAAELLEWLERRQQLVGQKFNVHRLYRKAEGIEDHMTRIPVPAVELVLPSHKPTPGSDPSTSKSDGNNA
jgi:hypothetical protein